MREREAMRERERRKASERIKMREGVIRKRIRRSKTSLPKSFHFFLP